MTRKEAIEQLQKCKDLIKQNGHEHLDERDFPLLDIAIEALKAQDRPIICPRCGRTFAESEGRERERMKINRDLNIELSPREVADEIWDMASDEQASLLNNLADIYQADFPHFCLQLGCVCGDFKDDYSEDEQEKVVRMLKIMVEYFDRWGEDE